MRKIWDWVRDRALVFWYFLRWFFGIDQIEPENTEHLPTILELRKENLELKAKIDKLFEINEALIDAGFFEQSPEDLDLERLKSQFGIFFIKSKLDSTPYEEFYFLRKTFMDSLSCAYLLGEKNADRATKPTS